jgi:hypothetical protein
MANPSAAFIYLTASTVFSVLLVLLLLNKHEFVPEKSELVKTINIIHRQKIIIGRPKMICTDIKNIS